MAQPVTLSARSTSIVVSGRPKYVYDFSRDYLGVAGLPPLLEALRHDPAFVGLNLSGTGASDCSCSLIRELLQVRG